MTGVSVSMSQKVVELATVPEVAATLAALGDPDLLRLRRIAQLRAMGLTAVDWRDVLNEAVVRVLTGSRKWPKTVPFVAFMAQTMRSIANEHWRQVHESGVTVEADLDIDTDHPTAGLEQMAVNAIHPEREVIARRTLADIEELFRGDSQVLAILEGLGEGLSPVETQEEAGISATQYASAQRRIRRELARAFKENNL